MDVHGGGLARLGAGALTVLAALAFAAASGENPPVHRDVRDVCRGGPGKDRRFFC